MYTTFPVGISVSCNWQAVGLHSTAAERRLLRDAAFAPRRGRVGPMADTKIAKSPELYCGTVQFSLYSIYRKGTSWEVNIAQGLGISTAVPLAKMQV